MRPLLVLALLAGCGEANRCKHRTEPETAVVTELTFTRETEGVSNGFDLDGDVTAEGAGPCGIGDYVDAEGNEGVDNAFARILPALMATEANAVEGLIANAIASGELLLMFEIDGLDDPEDDECADFTLTRGSGTPLVDSSNKVLANQTFDRDPEFATTTIEQVSFAESTVVARPFSIELPMQIFEVSLELPIHEMAMQVTLQEDGSYKGFFGGATDVDYLIGIAEYEDVDDALAGILKTLMDANADLSPRDDGTCGQISVNFDITAQPAFFYPSEEE
jgi:hypothetical protein